LVRKGRGEKGGNLRRYILKNTGIKEKKKFQKEGVF